jgi:predicted helicase
MIKGYIYLRDTEWYNKYNIYKLGITDSIIDRNSNYLTGEPISGDIIQVIEVSLNELHKIDKLLKYHLRKYHFYQNGGIEFYDKYIINEIEPILEKYKINYRILNDEEISELKRKIREKIDNEYKINNDNIEKYIIENNIEIDNESEESDSESNNENKEEQFNEELKPNDHQQKILNSIEYFYQKNNIGKLIWACGLGKALLSIFIIKELNFKSIVIGVPSKHLQKQMIKEILKIFSQKENIFKVGGNNPNINNKTLNKREVLLNFINQNNNTKFIITTYTSCYHLILEDIIFDFKIGDEAHHLVGIEKYKGYRAFHKIQSNKTLFMTATEKIIDNKNNRLFYTMNDPTIFGEYIDTKTVNWAIENKKITDYDILIIKNTEYEIKYICKQVSEELKDNDLFISCWICLKSLSENINNLSHLLLYTNNIDEANLANKYIESILNLNILQIDKNEIYYKSLNSKNCKNINNEIIEFSNKKYGIICCIYLFGEGFDLPKLNGVCVTKNMDSEIRIVQYLLRPNRLDKNNPNKKATIILSYEEKNTNTFNNICKIISEMRNIDNIIKQKITLLTIDNVKKNNIETINNNNIIAPYIENRDELEKINFKLKSSKILDFEDKKETEEYEYYRKINLKYNFKSVSDYNKIINSNKYEKEINNPGLILNAENYFKNKGIWQGWYHYLNINTDKYIQTKEEWVEFCKKNNVCSVYDYEKIYIIYSDKLPKEPGIFYNNFTTINNELKKLKRRKYIKI